MVLSTGIPSLGDCKSRTETDNQSRSNHTDLNPTRDELGIGVPQMETKLTQDISLNVINVETYNRLKYDWAGLASHFSFISFHMGLLWDYLGCVNIQDFALYESISASPCLHCHRRDVDLCLSPAIPKATPLV